MRSTTGRSLIDYSLYFVIGSRLCANRGSTVEETVKQAILGGASIIQLREKDPVPNTRSFVQTARSLLKITRAHNVPLIINDRTDVMLASGADGVHVGQSDMDPVDVRKLIGGDRILGVTVSNREQVLDAVLSSRADYVGTDAIFDTMTKTDARPIGLETLRTIASQAEMVRTPVVAIGGINMSNIQSILDTGVTGVAVISAISSSDNCEKSAGALRFMLDKRFHSPVYLEFREKMVDALRNVRQQKPLVHNITNNVVTQLTANAILAVGASPVMAHAHEEMQELSSASNALVLNIGTLDNYSIESMCMAAANASRLGKPVILDPVGCGASKFRKEAVKKLLMSSYVTILKGNQGEMESLCFDDSSMSKGVDSSGNSQDGDLVARTLASRYKCITAITGPIDIVSDGTRIVRIHHNVPLLTSITGAGCVVSAITGCFASVSDPLVAVSTALAYTGVCAEMASSQPDVGPASFNCQLLDMFARIPSNIFRREVKFSLANFETQKYC